MDQNDIGINRSCFGKTSEEETKGERMKK